MSQFIQPNAVGGKKMKFCPDCGKYYSRTNFKTHTRSKKHQKRVSGLPEKLIAIENADKSFHETWDHKGSLLNFPHPYRITLAGPPNRGKTTAIKNILIRARPMFKELYIIHYDKNTREYDHLEPTEIFDEIPDKSFWSGKNKTMVVIDDIEYKRLPKEQISRLDRLYGYISTHKNISLCCTTQDFFNLFPTIKRMSNIFVIWRSPDMDSFKMISRKCGIPMDKFIQIFEGFDSPHDSLWIDLTLGTRARIRKNGFEIIQLD